MFAGIIVDIIIIAICIVTIYLGYRRGLTSVLYGIIAFIISLIIVFILYKPVSNAIINNTQIDENIAETIKNMLPEEMLSGENKSQENTNISEGGLEIVNNYVTEAVAKAEKDISSYVAIQLSQFFVRIGTMILLFVISRIVLIIIKFATNIIAMLPIISTFNRLGGLIYGILKSLIIIYVCLAIFSMLSPIISSWGIIEAIEESHLGRLFYNNNIILNLITK